jgi:tetratricopeptide (TPR) repeat protein
VRTIEQARTSLASRPEAATAVRLADALLRQMRVTGNAGLAHEAEQVLNDANRYAADDHGVCRMLAAVLVSQHRFADGRARAERCLAREPGDTWLVGVIADANIELGDYEAAWTAIDRMGSRRPNAAAYARASYARELQGDLAGALELMQMALSATAPFDAESLAWHHAQLGHLQLELGRVGEAARSFAHTDHLFPDYPAALHGRVRVLMARRSFDAALHLLQEKPGGWAAPERLALLGDLRAALGDASAAERAYQLAEAAWMSDVPEPTQLARFLAARDRRVDRAVEIARDELTRRRDIFTEDAYAWASFRAGRLDDAQAAIARALRTGTADRTIRYHAAAIAAERGDRVSARQHLKIALAGAGPQDLIAQPAAMALARSLETEADR